MNSTTNSTCEALREEIGAALDGELSGARLREVEAHVGECESCQGERHMVLNARSALEDLETPPLPADFAARTVDRLLPLLQQRQRRSWWSRLLDVVLGSADPRPEPIWATVLGVGSLTMTSALFGTLLYHWSLSYEVSNVDLLRTSQLEHMQAHVWTSLAGLPSEKLGCCLIALCALMLLMSWRLARVRILWRTDTVRQGAGVALATLLGTWAAVNLGVLSSALLPRTADWGWQAAAGRVMLLGVTAGVAWPLFKRARGVTTCAVLFYAILCIAYGMDRAVDAAWAQAEWVYRLGWLDTGALFSAVQPQSLHSATMPNDMTTMVMIVTVVGALLAMAQLSLRDLGSSGRRATAARLLVTACIGVIGWRIITQIGSTLQEPALLPAAVQAWQRGEATPRNAVVLGRGGATIPYDLAALYGDGSVKTMREVLSSKNTVAFSQRRLLTIELQRADLLRWDLTQQLDDWTSALRSPWSLPWWPLEACARAGSEVAPDPRALEFLRHFENPHEWVIRNETTRRWIANELSKQGDDTWSRQLNLKFSVATAHERGSIHGTLLVNGKPASHVPVRIYGGYWYSDYTQGQGDAALLEHAQRELQRECSAPPDTDRFGENFEPTPVAVLTGVDGKFHFDHLPPHGYVLTVLLEGHGWTQRHANQPAVIHVTAGQAVDLGTVELVGEGGQRR
jgi:hypothetical protein